MLEEFKMWQEFHPFGSLGILIGATILVTILGRIITDYITDFLIRFIKVADIVIMNTMFVSIWVQFCTGILLYAGMYYCWFADGNWMFALAVSILVNIFVIVWTEVLGYEKLRTSLIALNINTNDEMLKFLEDKELEEEG